MIGPQDLGGRSGFGPVRAEPDEPIFHSDWEARVLGLTLCAGALGHWSLDESRHARECLDPGFYLRANYYDIWLTALEGLLERHGEVSARERALGQALQAGKAQAQRLQAEAVAGVLARGGPVDRPPPAPPRFDIGTRVVMARFHGSGHTRLPSYAMGREGIIEAVRGCHVLPDKNAHGEGEGPAWLYSVVFTGEALWGARAEPGTEVSLDAFEPYLTRA